MNDKINRYVFHPFLLAVYPILFLLSNNMDQIPLRESGRSLGISILMALVLTLLLGYLMRNFQRGGLLTSAIAALFFSYGHVYEWLYREDPVFENHLILRILWGILLVLGFVVITIMKNVGGANKYLNIFSFILIVPPLASIFFFILNSQAYNKNSPQPTEYLPLSQSLKDLPDIYYIILDGHGRSDIVNELFGYDNSAFINYLRQKGFYVADQGRSNYVQTSLSLASSLNYEYVNLDDIDPQSSDRSVLGDVIQHSKIRLLLEGQGYQFVTFSTDYTLTTFQDSDIFFPYVDTRLTNDFENLIFSTSALRAIDPDFLTKYFFNPLDCSSKRGLILNVFENLKAIPYIPGPKFVFAHVVSPHPPFIFSADGVELNPDNCHRISDGSHYPGKRKEYRLGYAEQLAYIDSKTREIIDIILERSPTPPIIIIQGDHGPGMFLHWNSVEKTCMRERTAILNAYYIPGLQNGNLYETITPVNSFRVVLNNLFGLNLQLLEDRTYYSTWDEPYQLLDVTNEIENTCRSGE